MHRLLAALFVVLPACYSYTPPPAPEPRDATLVNASVGATWEAAIDLFATRNYPIRTIERASGILATEGLSVDSLSGLAFADCGTYGWTKLPANGAIYNVLVRGDSTASTVRTTVRWSRQDKKGTIECTSASVWERELEEDIKERAESAQRRTARPTRVAAPAHASASEPGTSAGSADDSTTRPATPPPEEAPLPPATPRIRTNDQLRASPSFRQAVADAQRLKLVTSYEERRPDTLTVHLDDGMLTSASAEHNLGRLYLAYRGTTSYSPAGVMELMREGRLVGVYSSSGLIWSPTR